MATQEYDKTKLRHIYPRVNGTDYPFHVIRAHFYPERYKPLPEVDRSEVLFRQVKPDESEVLSLYDQIATIYYLPPVLPHLNKPPETGQALAREVADNQSLSVYAAVDKEGRVRGTYSLRPALPNQMMIMELSRFAVHPSDWGTEVGKNMIHDAISRLMGNEQTKFALLKISEVEGWQKAYRLYKDAGFRDTNNFDAFSANLRYPEKNKSILVVFLPGNVLKTIGASGPEKDGELVQVNAKYRSRLNKEGEEVSTEIYRVRTNCTVHTMVLSLAEYQTKIPDRLPLFTE